MRKMKYSPLPHLVKFASSLGRITCGHWLLRTIIFLSGLDYLLTWFLIEHQQTATESNPVADFVLLNGGWLGLFCFKAGLTCFHVFVSWKISRHRPQAAQCLRFLAVLALVFVVGYSTSIIVDPPGNASLRESEARVQRTLEKSRLMTEYHKRANRLAEKLIAGEIQLDEALRNQHRWSARNDHGAIDHLAVYAECENIEAVLATDLIRRTAQYCSSSPEKALEQFRAVEKQFQKRFHIRLPGWASEDYTGFRWCPSSSPQSPEQQTPSLMLFR